jgi:FtsP/CotA-like multicopper oxidase with cupredoxin domain
MTNFEANKFSAGLTRFFSVAALAVLLIPVAARAGINDAPVTGPITLTASEGYISIADGGSVYSWGYSTDGTMQLPGPTLILTQGVEVNITLTNELPAAAGNVSIVFPGQAASATDGVPGLLTQEAPNGGSVTYTFTPTEPGTYEYHSGTRPDLQVEMGLYGAIVVRPDSPTTSCSTIGGQMAYDHPGACFDREYLFLLSEIDLQVHQAAEDQASGPGPIDIGTGEFSSEYWLINGRAAPDTMAAAGTAVLTSQPYNSLPRMHPGEKLLLRVVGAGRDMHPFHTHGNHARVLAQDGNLIVSATDATKLAGPLLFTIPSVPGGTYDAIFEWTGQDLGWDMYGHTSDDPLLLEPNEWAPDHGKSIPVTLPSLSSLAFGGFYSGSPYLGGMGGSLPPGEGGLNPNAGFAYMWHSHTEIELLNNDVFPGGMMTMLIIEAPGVYIDESL